MTIAQAAALLDEHLLSRQGGTVSGQVYVTGRAGQGYGLVGKPSDAGHGGVLGYTQNQAKYGILGHANAYALYGVGQVYVSERVASGDDLWSATNVYAGNGAAFLRTDGQVYGPAWGGYISTWISNNYPQSPTWRAAHRHGRLPTRQTILRAGSAPMRCSATTATAQTSAPEPASPVRRSFMWPLPARTTQPAARAARGAAWASVFECRWHSQPHNALL